MLGIPQKLKPGILSVPLDIPLEVPLGISLTALFQHGLLPQGISLKVPLENLQAVLSGKSVRVTRLTPRVLLRTLPDVLSEIPPGILGFLVGVPPRVLPEVPSRILLEIFAQIIAEDPPRIIP